MLLVFPSFFSLTTFAEVPLPGIDVGIRSSSVINCDFSNNPKAASDAFAKGVSKLKNINRWSHLMLPPGQNFKHFSSSGTPLRDGSSPQAGEFIRIDPGFYFSGFSKIIPQLKGIPSLDLTEVSKAFAQISKKYFWVRIESVQVENQPLRGRAQIVVRPSHDPQDKSHSLVTKHMFSPKAANVFRVEQNGSSFRFSVQGTDEFVNLDPGLAPQERVVNTASSAMAWGKIFYDHGGPVAGEGLQKMIWGSFLSSALGPRLMRNCQIH